MCEVSAYSVHKCHNSNDSAHFIKTLAYLSNADSAEDATIYSQQLGEWVSALKGLEGRNRKQKQEGENEATLIFCPPSGRLRDTSPLALPPPSPVAQRRHILPLCRGIYQSPMLTIFGSPRGDPVWIKRLESAAIKPFLVRLSSDTDRGPKSIPPARKHWACALPAGSNYSEGRFLARRSLLELSSGFRSLWLCPQCPAAVRDELAFFFFCRQHREEKVGRRES